MALAVAIPAGVFVRGRIASLEDRRPRRPCPGRKRMFFCAERDVHEGSLRALMLPEPPAARRAGCRASRWLWRSGGATSSVERCWSCTVADGRALARREGDSRSLEPSSAAFMSVRQLSNLRGGPRVSPAKPPTKGSHDVENDARGRAHAGRTRGTGRRLRRLDRARRPVRRRRERRPAGGRDRPGRQLRRRLDALGRLRLACPGAYSLRRRCAQLRADALRPGPGRVPPRGRGRPGRRRDDRLDALRRADWRVQARTLSAFGVVGPPRWTSPTPACRARCRRSASTRPAMS